MKKETLKEKAQIEKNETHKDDMGGKKPKKVNTFFEDIQNLYMSADRLTKNTDGYNYKYVQLKDVLQEAKKLCLANNFIFIQTPKVREDGIAILETQLIHRSRVVTTAQTLLPTKDSNDPQKYGGAITYMRRYSLTAILGLEETDDDAAEASKEPTKKQAKALNNIDKMKQTLAYQGADSKEKALEMINTCGAFETEIKDISEITEKGADLVIKALTKNQDDED